MVFAISLVPVFDFVHSNSVFAQGAMTRKQKQTIDSFAPSRFRPTSVRARCGRANSAVVDRPEEAFWRAVPHFGGKAEDCSPVVFGEAVAGFAIGDVIGFAGADGVTEGTAVAGVAGAGVVDSGASTMMISGAVEAGSALVPVGAVTGAVGGERVGAVTALTGDDVLTGLGAAGFGEAVGAAGGKTTDGFGDLASEFFSFARVSICIGTGD